MVGEGGLGLKMVTVNSWRGGETYSIEERDGELH
jgi:hypothetical protein